jgi:hypothetical protein
MQRFLITIFFVISFICLAHAQNGFVSGYVRDKITQVPLAGASITADESRAATTTDDRGFFRLPLSIGTYTLKVSFIGYDSHSEKITVEQNKSSSLTIFLSPGTLQLDNIEISGRADQSVNVISQIDIKLRPVNTSQDVLRMIPGLFIAQHAGGGKAEQIFLRGFDIDHGTDINLEVDGLPVNMVSHAHGQGYSDLHFLIPELIQYVDFNKGPYYADKGDFTTAGYVSFNTRQILESNMIKVEGGKFGTARTMLGLNLLNKETKKGRQQAYVASEFFRSDGYFESHQDFKRFNATGKYRFDWENGNKLVASLSSFSSRWDASGQVPEREVNSGRISRFGSIDNTEGGETSRHQAYVDFSMPVAGDGRWENKVYTIFYDFSLFSNFTFYLNNPVDGDQIHQQESRRIYGYRTRFIKPGSLGTHALLTEIGGGVRLDDVDDIRLSNTVKRTTFISDHARGDVREMNANLYVSETLTISEKVKIEAALRLDHFTFQYDDRLLNQSAKESKTIVSPKFNVEYDVQSNTTIFLRSGFGFHSNDARVVVAQNGKETLPRARGLDLGVTTKIFPRMVLNAAGWILDLDQEFVYVGDEGIVEPGGKTRRMGTDLSLRYQVTNWLYFDGDWNLTHARSKDDPEKENYLPLAPLKSALGGITIQLKNGFSGSLRYRYLGDRPGNEDNSVVAKGYGIFDAILNYRINKFEFAVSAENILNEEWKEAQFDTESRLKEETEPVSEIHFTPGTPFFVKAGVTLRF